MRKELVSVHNYERYNPSISTGLASDQVEKRKKEGLINTTKMVVGKSNWEIIKSNILSFFNIMLLFLAALMIYANVNDNSAYTKWYSGLFFVGVLLMNIVIGLWQDLKAKSLMKKMRLITKSNVTVIRDSKNVSISPDEIVLDDILILNSGDQVVSDSILLEGTLSVNESLLTGESEDIIKKPGDFIYSGSFVTSGHSYAKVEKVGKDNYVETLSAKAKTFKRNPSHILKSLKSLFRTLSFIIIGLFIIILSTYAILGQLNSKEGFVNIIGPINGQFVAMVPAGLYLLTSFTLATGVLSLHKRNANVQDLYSIEMLARADVLCVDKTGTITDGTMRLNKVVCTSSLNELEIGNILKNIIEATKDNNATATAIDNEFQLVERVNIIKILPFKSANKYSAISTKNKVYILGAAEYINIKDRSSIDSVINEYTSQGLRVLLLGEGNGELTDDKYIGDVQPLGIVVLEDHIKDNVEEIFHWFGENRVDVKVISGDNAVTVSQIAKKAGIKNADKYISLEGKTLEEVSLLANQYNVFGRVTPEQKEAIVIALKKEEHVVAMTGDGVNDMLALKRADCSIAMNSGAQAAKNVSHIVLLTNDFGTMPEIVAEGRRVINNLERTGSLFLTKTLFAIFFSVFFWIVSIVTKNEISYPFSTNNLMIWETCSIGMTAFFLSLERNPKPINKYFMRNILVNAVPTATVIILSVLVVFGAYIFQKNGIMYTGISDFGFNTAFPREARYGATGIAVLVFSALSLLVLFNNCRPINKYRGIVFGVTIIATSIFVLVCCLLGDANFLNVSFRRITNSNLMFIGSIILIDAFILYYLEMISAFIVKSAESIGLYIKTIFRKKGDK